jgi:hypothetical protein
MLANLNLAPRAGNLPAIGQVVFSTAPSSGSYTIPYGQIFTNNLTNVTYTCTQTTVVTNSNYLTTYIPIACTQVGTGFSVVSGPYPTGTALTVSSPIGGVSSFTVTSMADGVNSETDGEVANRVIFAFQNPPGGGSISDFVNWAMQTSGVTYAYVFTILDNNTGITVIYVVIFAGTFNANAILQNDGIASASWITYSRNANSLVAPVSNYIQSVRPVNNTVDTITVETYIIPKNINVIVTLATGFTLTTNIPSVGLTVQQLIQREVRRAIISIPPGGVLVNGNYEIPMSLIAQTLDAGLSATSVQTGIYAAILVDRDVLYDGSYQSIPLPSVSGTGSLYILDKTVTPNQALIVYDVAGTTGNPYSKIIVTLA